MTKTLGLALGSGGARGWAHIGVIKALKKAQIPINYIAGSSIGAFVGGVHAAGEIKALEVFVRELSWKMMLSYFDLVFPHQGLLDGNKIYNLLTDQIKNLKIEEAEIPFCCIATDLVSGQEMRLQSGLMADAIRASISMPGVFTPFKKNDLYLGDGGIVNPVPVNVVREMGADVVLAVNLNHNYIAAVLENPNLEDNNEGNSLEKDEEMEKEVEQDFVKAIRAHYNILTENLKGKLEQWLPNNESPINIFDIIGTTINIMEQKVTKLNLEIDPPELLIEPDLCKYGIFDFHQADLIIAEGYQRTRQAIPKLRQLLAE
ncbi:patatin-like phospholipase family protein [Synechococcus sp. PCC 7502]|uniref:patatin-like phospholipase family protein n=1 Tax=Synechococcus sp. PCC 7502 TaxID=1173263 RepID=UPI00059D59BD|nr:patatin-like phospholipase family protein [Synechococcus sp. PCC 7502]